MIKREKRRYLALKAVGLETFDEWAVLKAIQSSLCRLFGEYGASKAHIKLMKAFPDRHQLVIRCSHTILEQVRAAIAAITWINGKNAAIHVLAVSGTLKALNKKTSGIGNK